MTDVAGQSVVAGGRARAHAIELANGGGKLAPTSEQAAIDSDDLLGVVVSKDEVPRLPFIIWLSDNALIMNMPTDGFSSYGRG